MPDPPKEGQPTKPAKVGVPEPKPDDKPKEDKPHAPRENVVEAE